MQSATSELILYTKIIHIDYYLWQPEHLSLEPTWLGQFTPAQLRKSLPVVRVIGRTPAGQTTCIHFHNAFPYVYVPCPETVQQTSQAERLWAQRLHVALEHALEQLQVDASPDGPQRMGQSTAASTCVGNGDEVLPETRPGKFIFSISVEWRRCIYGFHHRAQRFARIRYFHPAHGARIAQVLASGKLSGLDIGLSTKGQPGRLQPYEAHLPYLLQVMMDYGLAGFGSVGLRNGRFRPPLPQMSSVDAKQDKGRSPLGNEWLHRDNIPPTMVWNKSVRRHTDCALEVDAWLPSDLYPLELKFPSIGASHEVPNSEMERQVPSLRLIWESERQRRGSASWQQMWVPIAHARLGRIPSRMDARIKEQLQEVLRYALEQAARQGEGFGKAETAETAETRQQADWSTTNDLSTSLAALFGDHPAVASPNNLPADAPLEDDILWEWMERNYQKHMQPGEELFGFPEERPASPFPGTDREDEAEPADEAKSQRECLDILDCSLAPDTLTDNALRPEQVTNTGPAFDSSALVARASQLVASPTAADSTVEVTQPLQALPSFYLQRCSNASPAGLLVPQAKPPTYAALGWQMRYTSPFLSTSKRDILLDERDGPPMLPIIPQWRGFTRTRGPMNNTPSIAGNQVWLTPVALPPLPQNLERAWDIQHRNASRAKTRKVVEIHVDSYGREVRRIVAVDATNEAVDEALNELMVNPKPKVNSRLAERAGLDGNRLSGTRFERCSIIPHNENESAEPGQTSSCKALWTECSEELPVANEKLTLPACDQVPYDRGKAALKEPWKEQMSWTQSCTAYHDPTVAGAGKHLSTDAFSSDAKVDRNMLLAGSPLQNDTIATDQDVMCTVLEPPSASPAADLTTLWSMDHFCRGCSKSVADGSISIGRMVSSHGDEDATIATNHDATLPMTPAGRESLENSSFMRKTSQRPRTLSDETTTDSLPETIQLDEDERVQRPASPRYDEPSEFWSDVPHAARSDKKDSTRVIAPLSAMRPKRRSTDIQGPSQLSSGRDSTGTSSELTPLLPMGLHSLGKDIVRVLAVESFSITRREQHPDPLEDPLAAIAVTLRDGDLEPQYLLLMNASLRCQLAKDGEQPRSWIPETGFSMPSTRVLSLASEEALLSQLAVLVRSLDPDVLVSYSLRQGGIGHLLQRAAVLRHDLAVGLSRLALGCHDERTKRSWSVSFRPWERDTASGGIRLLGRYVLDVWRIMQSEVKLRTYSFHHLVEEILGRRMPQLPWSTQREWFTNGSIADCRRVLELVLQRAIGTLDLLEALDVMGRTAEMASSYGIDFLSALLRGSQYRVESLMARLAHTHGYVLVSPTTEQVRWQRATAFIPLVMEPEARYYSDPVLVLDFQSLYPSMIIAHNICFSTCLGRVLLDSKQDWYEFGRGYPRTLGVLEHYQPDWLGVVEAAALTANTSTIPVDDLLTVLPNQTVFVKPRVREGILPRLLREILETRMMLKRGMEAVEAQRSAPSSSTTERLRLQAVYRMLNARQFAMKYIANVTYGYTSASFSGRMPCAEIADAIVSAGRQAMERIVDFVEATWGPSHGARVVYGDTDSIFVQLPSVGREEAFQLGRLIADRCTALFPDPVRLKLEKVYSRSLLLAKKRYVGWAFESETQRIGMLDAKGIETVRRDSCGLVQKILERALRLLFNSNNDLAPIKCYVQRQLQRVIQGRYAFLDAVFFKEVQLGRYKPGYEPPAALVALQQMARDPTAIPSYRERVPYLVVYGEPGSALRELVMHPRDFLKAQRQGRSLRLNAIYYIRKQILPALDRCFTLMGVDVFAWFHQLPRMHGRAWPALANRRTRPQRSRIEHFLPGTCVACGHSCRPQTWLCESCCFAKAESLRVVQRKAHRAQRKLFRLQECCHRCIGEGLHTPSSVAFVESEPLSAGWYPPCEQIECALLVARDKATATAAAFIEALQQLLGERPPSGGKSSPE
jgi:DNA polymerase zeta